ncbi:DegT/DnrJ/EryC1/StrS family aminotransferase [Acidobacteriota bacterium]
MKKRYEFSLQYPKPIPADELGPLIDLAKSGLYSRYTNELTKAVEAELADYYESDHAVTCTSGTAALHGSLVALDFLPGSEIISTSVTDIGVVIPIIYENLIPVFADIDPETYNLDPESVEERITERTRAVIAVHLAGNPCDLDALGDICRRRDMVLIEDFSQAHGALWKGKKVGSYGQISYGSFQQSKQITCGEGGVIVTSDEELARRAFIGVDKGWQRHLPLEERLYEFLAPNVRFNAVQAAILQPQIKKLNDLVEKKRRRAQILYERLGEISDHIKPQKILDHGTHSYYSFPLYTPHGEEYRNQLVELLDSRYDLRCAYGYANPVPLYMCVNALIDPLKYGKDLYYSKRTYPQGTCPQAEALLKKSFLLPFNENFTEDEIHEIADRVVDAVGALS